MASPLLETKLHLPGAPRPGRTSETERAPEPRGGVGADAGVGAGRLRQDDAAGGVARRRSCRSGGPRRGCRSTSATTIPRCSGPTWSPRCRRRRPGSAPTRSRSCSRRTPPIEAVLATLLNDLGAIAKRRRAGARRLPRHRRARHPGRDGVPAGAPASAGASGDRQPRRPAVAAGAVAGARRAASRSAPPICASRPTRPRRTSTA